MVVSFHVNSIEFKIPIQSQFHQHFKMKTIEKMTILHEPIYSQFESV